MTALILADLALRFLFISYLEGFNTFLVTFWNNLSCIACSLNLLVWLLYVYCLKISLTILSSRPWNVIMTTFPPTSINSIASFKPFSNSFSSLLTNTLIAWNVSVAGCILPRLCTTNLTISANSNVVFIGDIFLYLQIACAILFDCFSYRVFSLSVRKPHLQSTVTFKKWKKLIILPSFCAIIKCFWDLTESVSKFTEIKLKFGRL